MNYPLSVPGFEGRQLMVKAGGFLSGAKLLIDGQPAPKGQKRGQLVLRRNDGVQVPAQLHNTPFDPVPQVSIDGQTIQLVKPLAWYQWLLIGFPIVLLFIGGALGGGLGAGAIVINTHIFRSTLPNALKYVAVPLVSLFTTVVYFVLAVIVSLMLQR